MQRLAAGQATRLRAFVPATDFADPGLPFEISVNAPVEKFCEFRGVSPTATHGPWAGHATPSKSSTPRTLCVVPFTAPRAEAAMAAIAPTAPTAASAHPRF